MRIAPSLAVVAVATGCTVAAGSTAPETEVTTTSAALTVDWTLAGTTGSDLCTTADAAAIEITVVDLGGRPVGKFQQSCTAFSTSVSLEAGIYAAEAQLIDGTGAPRTWPVRIGPVTLNDNSQLTTSIDFPPESFFGVFL